MISDTLCDRHGVFENAFAQPRLALLTIKLLANHSF
jgi:hypothetical protein